MCGPNTRIVLLCGLLCTPALWLLHICMYVICRVQQTESNSRSGIFWILRLYLWSYIYVKWQNKHVPVVNHYFWDINCELMLLVPDITSQSGQGTNGLLRFKYSLHGHESWPMAVPFICWAHSPVPVETSNQSSPTPSWLKLSLDYALGVNLPTSLTRNACTMRKTDRGICPEPNTCPPKASGQPLKTEDTHTHKSHLANRSPLWNTSFRYALTLVWDGWHSQGASPAMEINNFPFVYCWLWYLIYVLIVMFLARL